MNGVEQITAIVGVIVFITSAIPKLRHAAWTMLCAPARLGAILERLEALDEVKESNERATAASERALDEWRGAVQAVRELAGGHERRLSDHDRRLTELEGWRRSIENA